MCDSIGIMRMDPSARILTIGLGIALVVGLVAIPTALAQGEDVNFQLGPDEAYSHTFEGVGEGRYHCHAHASKGTGEIEVLGSDGSGPETHTIRIVDDGGDGAFDPKDITIRSGDTITWVNENDLTHDMMIWEPGSEVEDDHGHDDHGHGDDHHGGTAEAGAGTPLLVGIAALGLVALLRRR